MSYNNKSIKELHELLVNKEISALELTKATLSDIQAREPQIDAFESHRRKSFERSCSN